MRKNNNHTTVGKWILEKINTPNWRAGKLSGCKHYNHKDKEDSLLQIIDAVGSSKDFMKQVHELDKEGLITVKYRNVNTEVEDITISMDQVDRLCAYEGIDNEKNTVQKYKKYLLYQMQQTACKWLLEYENVLYEKLEKGTIEANLRDEKIFDLLNAIANLKGDIWKRLFSRNILGDSKTFENEYEDKIVTVLVNYSPKIDDTLKEEHKEKNRKVNDIILAEHGIMTYSQTLQWKGGIVYNVGEGAVDTSLQPYGTVINAQSLSHARIVSLKNVKRIITIENQANYEEMKYDPEILYIYTHGFLSPKERSVLSQINQIAGEDVIFEHWSDLDYGGIRIFQFMKNRVFSKVRPLYMDAATYKLLLENAQGCEISPDKRKKLEKMDAGELEELKQCILQFGKEFEQEALFVLETKNR